jgi:S-DNA-T family DNA segregation ATPase FtsK/SpoIIIE
MPHPVHEWSGVIGAFIATILTGLVGSAGSFLVLSASLLIAGVYATNSDLRKVAAAARVYIDRFRQKAAESKSAMSSRLGQISTDETDGADGSAGGRYADDQGADNEPARMVRRMRPAVEEPQPERTAPAPTPAAPAAPRATQGPGRQPAARDIPFPEPHIARPPSPIAAATAPAATTPTANVPAANIPTAAAPATEAQPALSRHEEAPFDEDPLLTNAARDAIRREQTRGDTPAENVNIVHGAPARPALSPTTVNRLTLNVQEGETDADLETEDEGELIERLKDEQIKYMPPSIELLVPQSEEADVNDEELKENGRILQEKLGTFHIQIENLTVTPGPVVTLYEFVPAAGIKIAQIESLTDDIALAMKARGIRIIAPIPGKGTVGVEIPNHKPAMVRIRSVLNTSRFREAVFRLSLALGKTTVGEVFCDDLAKMPHLLIAGATGSGKSVGVNAILASLLYKMHPSDLKFVIIDPKKIELSQYKALRNHFLARCPDIDEEIITNPQNAVMALKSLEMEMDRRYDILAKVGQRNIFDYNAKVAEGRYSEMEDFHHVKLPYIVLILDELADLMITAAKEVEEPIARLAQLARAIGIHMIVATQRPSVDVITGVIKANFPARIAYQVASKIDSRTILDMNGAEQLLGNGDMLYLPGGFPKPIRLQNAFISTEEVEEICEHIGKQRGYTFPYMLPSVLDKNKRGSVSGGGDRDDLFDEAAHLVVRHQQGSVSLIQRRLKVGYSRAARIVDELEMAGIVGPFDGSKARAVLLESEAELEAFL